MRFIRDVKVACFVVTVGLLQFSIAQEPPFRDQQACQTVTVPMCKNMPYNKTFMPNLLHHTSQREAGEQVKIFLPLVKVNCSDSLQIFLCSLYVPVCTDLRRALPPCRSLCESARLGCVGVMTKFGFNWPDVMECSKFPERSEDALCVPGADRPSPSVPPVTGQQTTVIPIVIPGGGIQPVLTQPPVLPPNPPPVETTMIPQIKVTYRPVMDFTMKSICPPQWRVDEEFGYKLRLPGSNGSRGSDAVLVRDCGAPCHGTLFSSTDEMFAKYWIGVWALVCLFSTLFTILTFLVDMRRFRYPERPIIFLSLCYFVVSLCYVVGFFVGDNVACKMVASVDGAAATRVATQGTKSEGCTVLFLLTYFFSMASSIWWVVLTVTWYLAAGLKWGHEAIESHSQYFHLAAWAVPAIISITVTALSEVEGDVLSGVCFTGVTSRTAQIGFVLAPLCLFLLIGVGFLVAGFVSLFHIRTVMKHGGTKTDKLEKLMVRIGIFSVLYIVPATIVIVCNAIEVIYKDEWMRVWRATICQPVVSPYSQFISCESSYNAAREQIAINLRTDQTLVQPTSPWGSDLHRPSITLFAFKYLGYLIVGITSGIWIWSGKTFMSWKRFFLYMLGREPPKGAAV